MSLDRLSAFVPRDGDVQLAVRLKRREPEALADLYDRFGGPTLALLTRMVGDKEQAAALLEQTFLTVWNRIPDFRGSGSALGLWIVAVARSQGLHCAPGANHQSPCLFDQPELFQNLPFGRTELLHLRDMYAAWASLDDKKRRAIESAFFDGVSTPDAEAKAALASLRALTVEPGGAQVRQEEREQADSRQE